MSALSGETENLGERAAERVQRTIHNDSPQPDAENRIVRKCLQELGIFGGVEEGGWRQLQGSRLSYGNSLAPQVGLEPTTLRLTGERLLARRCG